jgi:hypothetical protein
MMSLIPNVHPKLFTGSAILVGYLLIDDTTANEQNALGNWLMLMAQVLCTNAYYKQVMDERNKSSNDDIDDSNEIEMLEKMVKALNKEIEILKGSNN